MAELTPVPDTFKSVGVGLTPVQVGSAGTIYKNPNMIAGIGDSRIALVNSDSTGAQQSLSAAHFLNQANALQSFANRLQLIYNGGHSGYTSAEYLWLELANVLAKPARWVMMTGVLNDIEADLATANQCWFGYSLPSNPLHVGVKKDSTAIGGIKGALDRITANGQNVLIFTDYPQQSTTSAKIAQYIRYNDYLKEYAQQNRNVILIDLWPIIIDPTSATSSSMFRSGYMLVESPQTHPGTLGMYMIGQAVAAALDPLVPALDAGRVASRFDAPGADVDPITGLALRTNINVNSLFNEPAGGIVPAAGSSGSGVVTGTLEPGYTTFTGAGADAITITKAAGTWGNDLSFAITASAASDFRLQQAFNISGVVGAYPSPQVGDILQSSCEIDVAAGSSNFLGAYLELTATQDVSNTCRSMFTQASFNVGPTTAYSQILMTPKATISTGLLGFSHRIRFIFNGAGSATIKMRRLECRHNVS